MQLSTKPEVFKLDESRIAQTVLAERIKVFAERAVASAITSPLGTILLALIQMPVTGWKRALLWLCLINLTELCIVAIGYRVRIAQSRGEEILPWARWMIFAVFLTGVAWGSTVWFFWTEGEYLYYMLNIMVLIGVAGIDAVVMSPFRLAMTLFTSGVLLLPMLHLAMVPNQFGLEIMAGLTVLFILVLQHGRVAENQLTSGLENAVRNQALLGELARRTMALESSQAELTRAQAVGNVGSWRVVFGAEGEKWSGSDELYRIYEFSPGTNFTMQTGVEAVHPEDRERVRKAWLNAVKRTGPGEWEHRIVVNGKTKWVAVRVQFMFDADGRLQEANGIVQDITERKRVEAERAQLEVQLRESQKMEALGTLAGGVAHDFNNVLAAILGNVELAKQDVGAGHAALVSLEEIAKSSRRAKDLVQQILAFGRRQTLDRKATSLSLVVVESARLIRATLPAAISLNVDFKADTPPVLADATQVKQILLNLCQNALHAVQNQARPGAIEIHLEPHTQVEAREDLRPGRYACLSVRDNGPGMDEATRSRIFEPFFTTKPKGEGTGLGLSVVHGIVQAHGATMQVDSIPGQGTTFRIYFPATDAPPAAGMEPAADGAPARGAGKRVLYVDDEEAIVFLMQRLLERQGYRVSGFTDPQQAVAAARANPEQFDLAVTDYNMPGMSGLEVATALREIRADLPVVMASGYITEELRASAPSAGVRELIYKPNTVDDLCEAVARFANTQSEIKSSS